MLVPIYVEIKQNISYNQIDIRMNKQDNEKQETVEREKQSIEQEEHQDAANSAVSFEKENADEFVQLNRQVESLQEALKEAEGKVLRVAAEMENLRRRSERDIVHAHKYANEGLLKALLPILDSFETGRQSSQNADVEKLLDGLAMIEKLFLKALDDAGVELIMPSRGEPFKADEHQAMTTQPSDEMEANCIVEVYQRGFQLNGRLVRPAMVVVSTAT